MLLRIYVGQQENMKVFAGEFRAADRHLSRVAGPDGLVGNVRPEAKIICSDDIFFLLVIPSREKEKDKLKQKKSPGKVKERKKRRPFHKPVLNLSTTC